MQQFLNNLRNAGSNVLRYVLATAGVLIFLIWILWILSNLWRPQHVLVVNGVLLAAIFFGWFIWDGLVWPIVNTQMQNRGEKIARFVTTVIIAAIILVALYAWLPSHLRFEALPWDKERWDQFFWGLGEAFRGNR